MTAAWHPDPTGRHELRYWDGARWTEHVSDHGTVSTSPLDAPPSGTAQTAEEVAQPEPAPEPTPEPAPQAAPAPMPQAAPAAMQGAPAPAGGGAFAGISGDLVDGRFAEVGGSGVVKQNARMLKVSVTEPFLARQGSMVAYQGDVAFAHQGAGGAARFLKKAITGEGLALMRVEGRGDVFLADVAKHVHVLHLNGTGISINGDNVLAFSASLDWNIERVRGGSVTSGGLFNTTLRGTGWVAITTDGDPVVLDAGEAPTFADTQAVVAWSVDLETNLRSTVTAGALIGRGSGEAFQVTFAGRGFVIVQPSEGAVVPPHTH